MQPNPSQSVTPKRQKFGRWNRAESQLFEVLVERYGKNWKKIQSFIKSRTLAQVRSHGQKFFERVGQQRTQEYERRAKLMEAIEILKLEKVWQQEVKGKETSLEIKQEQKMGQRGGSNPIIREEDSEMGFPEGNIKEQFKEVQRMEIPQKSPQNTPKSHPISMVQTRSIAPIICYPSARSYSSANLQDFQKPKH